MGIEEYLLKKKRLINRSLNGCIPSSRTKPQLIHKAMRYAVLSGGKRIRPILTIASFETCGGRGSSIILVACAIELIHTYTLIHDDMPCMDDDDYRRGKLSCHKRFDEAIALLTGDALLTLGFELLSDAGRVDIVREVSMAVGTRGTIGGQAVDILEAKKGKRKAKSELDYITSRKTGALFEAAVKTGALLKGVSAEKMDSLVDFSRAIGFTFQLVDDLIDKDGYARVYEPGYVKKMARLLTERAKGRLKIFGKDARRLSEIADLILERPD